VLLAPLVPAAYYFLLGLTDASWELSQENYSTGLDATMSWRLALALAPLAIPALLGYRGRAEGLQERVLRLWAPLGVVLYLFPETPVRFHAFNGLSIPLAILAVRGAAPYLARWARRIGQEHAAAAAIAGCAFLVLPGTVDRIRSARGAVYLNQQPYNLEAGERDALEAMERAPGGGGVMTPVDLAALVPYRAGRETWVGTPSWSPDFGARATAVANLFAGRLSPPQARRLVRASRVRFVLLNCRAAVDLGPALDPIARARRYGCVTLYDLSRSNRPAR
jgi:hypothetical protein